MSRAHPPRFCDPTACPLSDARPARAASGNTPGFTLVELLVVVAIISILTAILLPVFFSVRGKARQIACLSNARQIGLAFTQYTQDYDEMLPSVTQDNSTSPTTITDAYQLMMPYAKSLALFHCPERSDHCGPAVTGVAAPYADDTCIGYGYNHGPIFPNYTTETDGGLIQNYSYNFSTKQFIHYGIPLSQIVAPADTFAFGDTYDTPLYTVTLNAILSDYPYTTTGQLRHGGRLSMVFCDGHVKSILWHAGTSAQFAPGRQIAMPVDPSYWPGWCSDPNRPVVYDQAGDSLPCGQIPALAASGAVWDAH